MHGLLYLPDPPPKEPVSLLLNVHGHWGAGVAADEVNRRAQIAARSGWMVLSITSRGMEHGGTTPAWRRLHHREALYAQLRSRRSGGTPLGWDVVAGWSAVDLASTGRLPLPVDMDRIGIMGFSGGAERAAAIAATDPRVGPVVVGAYEYAFSSGHGHASCSCGAVRGAAVPLQDPAYREVPIPPSVGGYQQPVQGWRWLGLAACRPGVRSSPRRVLAWDNLPDDISDSELFAVAGVESREVPGMHGVTAEMAAVSWGWMESVFGAAVPKDRIEEAEAWTVDNYLEIQPRTWLPLTESQPAPGRFEQGPPPWRVDAMPSPAAARAMLGLIDEDGGLVDPGLPLLFAGEAEQTLLLTGDGKPRTPRSGESWLVVLGEEAPLDALGGLAALSSARPEAVILVVRHRLLADGVDIALPVRWGIELGTPALSIAVYDVLMAHRRLADHPAVNPARIGVLALGSGAVPGLQAALLIGEGGPISLVGAPTTLFFDGPRQGDEPFAPWPEWAMVPLPGGASFDPWVAARSLGDRIRWLDPRGGDGRAWDAHLPHGAIVSSLPDLLAPDRRPQ